MNRVDCSLMALDHNLNGNGAHPGPDSSNALELGAIQPYFLPKVDMRAGRVIGVEALARWEDPASGPIAAADFLARIETGGQMRALTERMISSSIRAAGDWWRSGLGLQLSVNLSSSIFAQPDWGLHQFVAEALKQAGLPGTALQVEVTEDALVRQGDRATTALEQLAALGTTVSIDDFGTGHFSFRQLMNLPVEELKIDRSLILGLDEDQNRTIVRSTIHLAHQIGLQVVAEGVETQEAWRQLRSMGCERAQGFLIAKPLPAREVPAWLAAWNQRARELSSTKRVQRRSGRRPSGAAAKAAAT
jgi:EAL domain-containing protein (putative c-di-GMP-specific phosphodiesterase class I)